MFTLKGNYCFTPPYQIDLCEDCEHILGEISKNFEDISYIFTEHANKELADNKIQLPILSSVLCKRVENIFNENFNSYLKDRDFSNLTAESAYSLALCKGAIGEFKEALTLLLTAHSALRDKCRVLMLDMVFNDYHSSQFTKLNNDINQAIIAILKCLEKEINLEAERTVNSKAFSQILSVPLKTKTPMLLKLKENKNGVKSLLISKYKEQENYIRHINSEVLDSHYSQIRSVNSTFDSEVHQEDSIYALCEDSLFCGFVRYLESIKIYKIDLLPNSCFNAAG